MSRGGVIALCALASLSVHFAWAQTVAPYGPPPPPAMPDGYARDIVEVAGDPSSRLVIWRPAVAGGTMLIDAEDEPSLAALPPRDLLQIARAKKMTVLFLGAAPDSPAPEKLRETITRLRSASRTKRIIGAGVGQSGDLLQKLAGADRDKLFDALLLLGAAPSKPPGRNVPFTIEIFGPDVYWRPIPRAPEPQAAEPGNRRVFFLAGGAASGALETNCAAPVNDRSAEPARRVLLVALDDFLQGGPPPPASRRADLAPAESLAWPKIPGLPAPPPGARLVPKIDVDGNESSGLRLPDQALPIATFTGWNAVKDTAKGDCASGAKLPFPISRAAREASGDPRQSLPERYGSRAYFVGALRSVADRLVKERLLLPQDADAYVAAGKEAPF
jgi:Alpha/beta hydrolase domain